MASVRQTNFGGGELSPLLHGRTDLPIYARGLRTCRNFMVTREAMAVSRPGTLFLAQAKYRNKRVRLVPFIYSDTVSYVLEVGEGYIRFFSNGAIVESSPGTPLEVATTYLEGDLRELRYAQTGLVLTLTHPRHRARELRAPAWTLTDVQFGPPSDGLTGTPMRPRIIGLDGAPKANPLLVDNPADTLFVLDQQHPPREWRWLVTSLVRHKTDGRLAETMPMEIDRYFDGADAGTVKSLPADRQVVLYPPGAENLGRGVLIRTPNFGAAANLALANWDVVGLAIYRGRGSLSVGRASMYGLIGVMERAVDFLDDGREPDYLTPPPLGTNPFGVFEYPVAVSFFEERRVFGGTSSRPGTLFLSATGDYGNHDVPAVIIPSQALEFELAARTRQAIRHLVTMGHLIVLTDTAVWRFGGTAGEPLGPTTVEARVVDAVGSELVAPLQVDGSLLWVRNKGRGARALVPSGEGYAGVDLSAHAQHLFFGGEYFAGVGTRQIRDWAYAEDPFGIIWVVREDGGLLSLTYSREAGMAAWARHDSKALDDGNDFATSFTAVCSVPEGGEDAVYVAVFRSGALCIERMASRIENDSPTDGCCVDSAVQFSGLPTNVIGGLAHLEGRQVWFTSAGPNPPYGPLRVAGGSITLPEVPLPNSVAPGTQDDTWLVGYVGLRFVPELETLDAFGAGEGRMRQKSTTAIGFEVNSSRGLAVGQDFEHLDEWEQRAVTDDYQASDGATELVDMHVAGTYNKTARGCLRQTKPLPVTVVGLTREVDVGER